MFVAGCVIGVGVREYGREGGVLVVGWRVGGRGAECVFLIGNYLPIESLKSFIKNTKITVKFILGIYSSHCNFFFKITQPQRFIFLLIIYLYREFLDQKYALFTESPRCWFFKLS